MQIDGEEYIGSQPTCMGLVGLCTGILEPSAVDSIHKDGSFAFDTVVCKIVEPTEDELELVPMLQ
jgi:hypothetical protein